MTGYFGVNCEMANFTTTPAPTTQVTPQNETCAPQDDCDGHIQCVVVDGLVQRQCLDGWMGDECKDRNFTGAVDPQCPVINEEGDIADECKNGGTCFNQTCCCVPGCVIYS